MSAPLLYPDPPHLSAALYCDPLPEDEAFGRLCRAVQSRGGVPTGIVEVFPAGTEFDFVTDVHVSEETGVPEERFWDLVEGKVRGLRALKAGFTAKPVGPVVVSYEFRHRSDSRHPLDAHTYAGMLGIPKDLWEPPDQAAAARTADWIRYLLERACNDIKPLYAALVVEETLPTPSDLALLRSQDIYIADRVLAVDPNLEPDLTDYYGRDRIERWEAGIFCVGWDEASPGKLFSKRIAPSTHWPGTRLADPARSAAVPGTAIGLGEVCLGFNGLPGREPFRH